MRNKHMVQTIISASLSPNTERNDVFAAISMLVKPWKWLRGESTARVMWWFKSRYPDYTVHTTNSGRSSLYLILKSFGIGPGDLVMVQSFTCVAVPNAVLWAGAVPIYVDIDASLNIDLIHAEKNYHNNVRAIIVQHTLGMSANMDKLVAFARKHNILLIEDCAHALGAKWKGRKLGSYGDAAFFSFGRDKVISSVFGGVSLIRSHHTLACKKMDELLLSIKQPTRFFIFQQLLHPILFSIALPLYRLGIGKIMVWAFQKIRLLSFPVFPEEKYGKRPDIFPSHYPNALAYLTLLQLSKLDRYNAQRIKIAQMYTDALKHKKGCTLLEYPSGSIFLRFPLLVEDPASSLSRAKKMGILLGNWYHNVIDPEGVDFAVIRYTQGSCPVAERYARSIINLPTNISIKSAEKVLLSL